MKAIDAIRTAMKLNEQDTQLIEDMHDAPLTQPTSAGGNHPLWVLGHLAVTEGSIPEILFGAQNPVEPWKPLFDAGSEPKADTDAYPPFDEVLSKYRVLRAETLKLLDEMDDADLDKPTKNPPKGAEEFFRTVGQTLLLTALHQSFHSGQVADARRAAGRKPMFM